MFGKVTIGMLAAAAGVSPATVSLVLNDRPLARRIPAETRERIRELSERLHYRPSGLAQAMLRQRTGFVGFVCGGIESPYFSALCGSLSRECERRGCHLLILPTDWDYEKELDALDLICSRMVDGIVLTSDVFSTDNPRLRHFRRPELPLVVCSEHVGGDCCSVCPDYATGMEELFGELASRGVRRVTVQEVPSFPAKGDAAAACGGRRGIRVERILRAEEDVAGMVGDVLARPPEVLIGSSDVTTMGMVSGLASRGVRIPEEVSCVSIDGTALCRSCNPALAAVEIDYAATMRAVLDLIERKLAGDRGFVHRAIPTRFVDGASLRR